MRWVTLSLSVESDTISIDLKRGTLLHVASDEDGQVASAG
jgi:hypothetical protein